VIGTAQRFCESRPRLRVRYKAPDLHRQPKGTSNMRSTPYNTPFIDESQRFIQTNATFTDDITQKRAEIRLK